MLQKLDINLKCTWNAILTVQLCTKFCVYTVIKNKSVKNYLLFRQRKKKTKKIYSVISSFYDVPFLCLFNLYSDV